MTSPTVPVERQKSPKQKKEEFSIFAGLLLLGLAGLGILGGMICSIFSIKLPF